VSFDALTLSAIRDELAPLLTEARLQKLVFSDELSMALEAFAPDAGRTNVLLSADLEHGRVQRISHLPQRGLQRDTPFSLVARKHLRNARVRSVHQPRLERVFELDCEQRDASGQHYRVLLIVEAMGRRSNLVLVDQLGTILDAARRTPPSRNSRRPILPHLPYVAPPAQDRLMPEQISSEALAQVAQGKPGSLARFLSDRIAGLSPLTGRELAFRATGAADATLVAVDWPSVVRMTVEFMAMVDRHAWLPTVAFDEAQRPLEFAPYELSHLAASGARLQSFTWTSEAMEVYYSKLAELGPPRRGDLLLAERRALLAPLQRTAQTTERRIAALEHQLASGHEQRDPLRHAGETILAHQAGLAGGSTELLVDGQRFELDAQLSGVENAQAYFARYRKAREAEERVPELLEQARNHASHLADLQTMVEVADQMDAIRALRREVGAATSPAADKPTTGAARDKPTTGAARDKPTTGAARDKPAKPGKGGVTDGGAKPGSRRSPASGGPHRRVALGEGWEALLGASAAGNAAVTFDLAQPYDLWLHARGVPGAHVILRTHGTTPPDNIIERAAQLAAWHSAARTSGAAEVDLTERRHVRKIPNSPPGLVRYTNERTVRVPPKAYS
jgi:predicted ribosome quality control (RQC) complex YloA/Tae2 family protein